MSKVFSCKKIKIIRKNLLKVIVCQAVYIVEICRRDGWKWPGMTEWWGLQGKCSLPIYIHFIVWYNLHTGRIVYKEIAGEPAFFI